MVDVASANLYSTPVQDAIEIRLSEVIIAGPARYLNSFPYAHPRLSKCTTEDQQYILAIVGKKSLP